MELGDSSSASSASWLHVSGITPLLGDPAKKSWLAALQEARHLGLPTSLDLNWRKQLGEGLSEIVRVGQRSFGHLDSFGHLGW